MENATECKHLVKELRAFARQAGVTQVRDDSSRADVEAMFQRIVAKAPAVTKSKVTNDSLYKLLSAMNIVGSSHVRAEPKSSLRCSKSFDTLYK